MITIQLTLKDQTLVGAIQAASQHGMSLDQYVETRLCDQGDEGGKELTDGSIDPIDRVAQAIFGLALNQPTDGRPYLIKKLHAKLDAGSWKDMGPGFPSRLGKAFMRFVKAQPENGIQLNDNTRVRVESVGPTAQNQMRYLTKKVE
nr:hypothetical protein [uncultured Pseudomonas sp.]